MRYLFDWSHFHNSVAFLASKKWRKFQPEADAYQCFKDISLIYIIYIIYIIIYHSAATEVSLLANHFIKAKQS